jgi:hypothetical protein
VKFGGGVAIFIPRGFPDKKEFFELDDKLLALKLLDYPIDIDMP